MNLIDMHCDTLWKMIQQNEYDLMENPWSVSIPAMKEAGTLAQFFACFTCLEEQNMDYEKCYEQALAMIELLKKNWLPIVVGASCGSLASMGSVLLMCKLFGMDEAMTVSLIPKSVTTPIAVSVAEGHGGMVPITVVAVIFTGILGSIFAPTLIRLFRVNDPMIAGISIGACSHAVGTSKAIELGETEGAMSGLAIGVCGILTVLFSMILMH